MSADLRTHRFICHFPAAQGLRLARHVRLVRFPHQAVVFAEGSRSDCIYLVFSGRVALTKKSPGGAAQIIAYKGPDDYFGELGVTGVSKDTAWTVAAMFSVLEWCSTSCWWAAGRSMGRTSRRSWRLSRLVSRSRHGRSTTISPRSSNGFA